MRSAIGYLVVALALFLGGRVLFGASSLEQRTADAEQALLTLRYGDLDATYEALATEAADRAPIPRVSQALVSSLRAQQSTTRYWLGNYRRLEPRAGRRRRARRSRSADARAGRPRRVSRGAEHARSGAAVKRIDDIVRAYTDVVRARPATRTPPGTSSSSRGCGPSSHRAASRRSPSPRRAAWPAICRSVRRCTARRRAAAGRRHEAVQGGGADAARRTQAVAAGRQRGRTAQEARLGSPGAARRDRRCSPCPPSTGRRWCSGSRSTVAAAGPALLLVIWVWQFAPAAGRHPPLPASPRRAGARAVLVLRRAGLLAVPGGATACVVLALARPQVVTTRVRRAGVDLVVLQDGSTSMRVTDMTGNRWRRSMSSCARSGEAMRWDGDRAGDDVVRPHRHAAGAADQGPEHVLLLRRSPHRAAVPRRGRRLVGHQHRDGRLVGAQAARPGRAHHRPALAERQGIPAALRRPGVERRGGARAAAAPASGASRCSWSGSAPATAGSSRSRRPTIPRSRRRRSTRGSIASRWRPSPPPAAAATWSSTARRDTDIAVTVIERCASWPAAGSRKAPTTSTGRAWRRRRCSCCSASPASATAPNWRWPRSPPSARSPSSSCCSDPPGPMYVGRSFSSAWEPALKSRLRRGNLSRPSAVYSYCQPIGASSYGWARA